MKKAAAKAPSSSPAGLGQKRQCPKCATKFYDFGKEEIICPKCKTEIDPEALVQAPKPAPEPKRAAKVVDTDDEPAVEGVAPAGGEFESVDDLSDDEDVAGVEVDEDEDEESF